MNVGLRADPTVWGDECPWRVALGVFVCCSQEEPSMTMGKIEGLVILAVVSLLAAGFGYYYNNEDPLAPKIQAFERVGTVQGPSNR